VYSPFFIVELASDGLKGRVFEVSLADLQDDEVAFRKFKLIVEEVQGKHVLTNFHGMTMTTDKLRSLVKKWQVSDKTLNTTTGRCTGINTRDCHVACTVGREICSQYIL